MSYLYGGYSILLDRASSDSDRVATDNLAQAVYLTYENPLRAGVTGGYQFDANDDFVSEVKANSYFFSGWCKAVRDFEFRFEFGSRLEDVKDGARLLGNEDRTRFKAAAKYMKADLGALSLKYEGKIRKNDDIGSKADFNSIAADFSILKCQKYFDFSGGYSFSTGKYENREKNFEFRDNLLYGNIQSREFCNLSAGVGGQYYRSKRDVNVESFSLHFEAAYRFFRTHRIEAIYNVYNFDDFLVPDDYSTENLVEVNLIKELSF